MANLKLVGVNKVYPSGKAALFDINLTSSDGEFIAVTGGAGSGKSTLIRVIAGLEDATSGDIYIGDKLVNDMSSKERDVAVIFAGNTLNQSVTVAENIAYGLKIRNVPAAVSQQRVNAAAEILGLSDVLQRKPKTITAAQRLLACYARAMVREPKLYLFDDPIAGLDDKLRNEMRNVFVNLQARVKGTFIYATKSISEAMSMANRIVILCDGFIQQVDTPRNLYDYPANAYVAFFVGSPTINFIRGAEAVEEDGCVKIVYDGKKFAVPESIVARWQNKDEYIGTGRKIIAGIRPEDITVGADGAQFEGMVSAFEETEAGKLAEVTISKNVSLELFMEKPEKGAAVKLCADLSHLYLFDEETQLTLLSRDGGYIPCANNSEADYVPPAKGEMEARKKALEPKAENKKKK